MSSIDDWKLKKKKFKTNCLPHQKFIEGCALTPSQELCRLERGYKYNVCIPGMGLARARNVCWMAALWKNAKHTKWHSCQRLWGQDPRPQWVLVFSPVFRAFHIQSKTVWKAQGFVLEEVKMAELMMVNQVSNFRKYHGWEACHIRAKISQTSSCSLFPCLPFSSRSAQWLWLLSTPSSDV